MTVRPTRPPSPRPPVNSVQRQAMILTFVILLAGTITFIVTGRGFVIALAGLCATAAVVIGTGIDFLRR